MTTEQDYKSNMLFQMQISLAQYPILQDRISEALFNQIIQDGFLTFSEFEENVRDFALMSQRAEGLNNPFAQEGSNTWENRLVRVRIHLINQYFAQHYSIDFFNKIVDDIVQNRTSENRPLFMWHNMEFTSIDTIFEQALMIERMAPSERTKYEAKLTGAKVVLIRRLISDQLPYIDIAKNVLSIQDLIEISKHRIGKGAIGGKAAGMLLAQHILKNAADEEIRSACSVKESFFIGSEEYYSFLSINDMLDVLDFKYSESDINLGRFHEIRESFRRGNFSKIITETLERIVQNNENKPLIVRSSSLLEDGCQYTLSGLYDSYIIPNQGTTAAGLEALLDAIRKIYSSTIDPHVLAYRKQNGLLDYPESMGILIQVITGTQTGNYLFPDLAGVGASQSPYLWCDCFDSTIKDRGYLRLVSGIGTRSIKRTGYDFPQIISLSEPDKIRLNCMPDITECAQQEIDLINLKSNRFTTVEIQDAMTEKYALLPWIAQMETEGQLKPIARGTVPDRLIISFADLLKKSSFVRLMNDILSTLERAYHHPVFIEFTASVSLDHSAKPTFQIQIDKCRPLYISPAMKQSYYFPEIPENQLLFQTDLNVQNGILQGIQYLLVIDEKEIKKQSPAEIEKIIKSIRALNQALKNDKYIILADIRLGTTSDGGGLPVRFSDFSNASAIVEITNPEAGKIIDNPAGTQVFQNWTEAGIYSTMLNLSREITRFDTNFFTKQNDIKQQFVAKDEPLSQAVKLFSTNQYHGSQSLTILFDQTAKRVSAFFV